jgi:CubicO group peptidase (beta-lactamase class C family)
MTGWHQVDHILQTGLASGVYTAAVCLAGRAGEVSYARAVGRLSRAADSPAVSLETVFDLASLTKTLATTLALVLLVQQGRLSLQTDLGDLLPSWLPDDKKCLPLVDLLTHQSGLPAWQPFYETVLTLPAPERPAALERLAAVEPLEPTPGKLTIYSDLGFMLLKAVVESVSGQSLDAFCRHQIYQPLGLTNLGFRPLIINPLTDQTFSSFPKPGSQAPLGNLKIIAKLPLRHRKSPLSPPGERIRVRGEQPQQYAATEVGLIPGRTIQGQVHDENAWSAGGVAGHAGLFGTGPEVFRLAGYLYQAYNRRAANQFFDPDVIRSFMTPPPGAGRALGFDVPGPREASCGRFFSPGSRGHLGFTGVSYWIDVNLGQSVILLSNRVHLGRDNETIKPFRPRLYEAASQALGFTVPYRF